MNSLVTLLEELGIIIDEEQIEDENNWALIFFQTQDFMKLVEDHIIQKHNIKYLKIVSG